MGVAEASGVVGCMQALKNDLAKLNKDIVEKPFSCIEIEFEAREWIETCERIFAVLELRDATKRS